MNLRTKCFLKYHSLENSNKQETVTSFDVQFYLHKAYKELADYFHLPLPFITRIKGDKVLIAKELMSVYGFSSQMADDIAYHKVPMIQPDVPNPYEGLNWYEVHLCREYRLTGDIVKEMTRDGLPLDIALRKAHGMDPISAYDCMRGRISFEDALLGKTAPVLTVSDLFHGLFNAARTMDAHKRP